MKQFSNYQLGGIALAVCPNPKLGLVPNHDIFHSKVSWSRRSSSGEKCNNVATALVKWRALKTKKKYIYIYILHYKENLDLSKYAPHILCW